jgi:NCAIR mutase (PurE)-related protein
MVPAGEEYGTGGIDGAGAGVTVDSVALRRLLERVRDGEETVAAAAAELRDLPYQDLGYARLDHHRPLRTGWPEVVLGEGKTPAQIAGIVSAMVGRGHTVLVTRASAEAYAAVAATSSDAEYNPLARCIVASTADRKTPSVDGVLIVTAGTADLPVAEEAAMTAELMGSRVCRINDVGVAGLHRLLSQREVLQTGRVIVVVAGMEGALASVVAGLVAAPVIAVPTSVGYGASFGGMAALLGMLNACAPGVSVVNIDNGFGAGYLAAQINLMAADPPETVE